MIIPSSGIAFLRALIVLGINPSLLKDSLASKVLILSSITGNKAIAGIPNL